MLAQFLLSFVLLFQATPSPLTEPHSIAVQRAFDLLMDRFVEPLDGPAVLLAGWQSLADEATAQNAAPPGPPPTFGSERSGDSAALRESLADYERRVPATPDFVPAYAVIRGMARFAHERHTYFQDPEHFRAFQESAQGAVRYGGIGVGLESRRVFVNEVLPGSPADMAGLRPGDQILSIDGAPADDMTPAQASERIRGVIGSRIELVIHKSETRETVEMSLRREQIVLEP